MKQTCSNILVSVSFYLMVFLLKHLKKRQNANYQCSMTTVLLQHHHAAIAVLCGCDIFRIYTVSCLEKAIALYSILASSEYCHLLITFANRLA